MSIISRSTAENQKLEGENTAPDHPDDYADCIASLIDFLASRLSEIRPADPLPCMANLVRDYSTCLPLNRQYFTQIERIEVELCPATLGPRIESAARCLHSSNSFILLTEELHSFENELDEMHNVISMAMMSSPIALTLLKRIASLLESIQSSHVVIKLFEAWQELQSLFHIPQKNTDKQKILTFSDPGSWNLSIEPIAVQLKKILMRLNYVSSNATSLVCMLGGLVNEIDKKVAGLVTALPLVEYIQQSSDDDRCWEVVFNRSGSSKETAASLKMVDLIRRCTLPSVEKKMARCMVEPKDEIDFCESEHM